MRHFPALDGLRGLAILLVVPSNFHWGHPRGGFLGVDLFFVLSGFLITSLLLAEHDGLGRIRIGAFYMRRALRLLPALLLLVAVLLAYALLAGSPSVLQQTIAGALYTILYVGNWYLAFGGTPALEVMGPLSHTWSLSVEEQFYFVWPLLLLLLLATPILRRRYSTLALLLGLLVLIAAGWRAVLALTGASWNRLYFSTDTRADALLVGCCVGVIFAGGLAARWSVATVRFAGWLGVLIFLALGFTAQQNHISTNTMGHFVAAAAGGVVILHLVSTPDGVLARAFSASWLTWVGRVSYGIYLWHVPIGIVLDTQELASTMPPVAVEILRLGATLTAVVASYYLVERPFLRLKRRFAGASAPTPAIPA